MATSSGWMDILDVAYYYANDTNQVIQAAGTRDKWNDMGMVRRASVAGPDYWFVEREDL